MSAVYVTRLRGIAETVRQLPTFYYAKTIAAQYFKRVCEGAKFIREAETLGAFQGGRIGTRLRHPSCHDEGVVPTVAGDMPVWKLTVWYAVVDTLAPELIGKRSRSIVRDANGNQSMRFDTSPREAEIVAEAIEAEAARLEAQSKTTEHGGQDSDPICDALSGQPLTLYEFLVSRTHFTSFDSLAELPNCWRKPNPQSDETVLRGLRRLRDELNDIDAAPALIIDKKHRRTKLDKPTPK